MDKTGMKSVRVLAIAVVVALCLSVVPMITGKNSVMNVTGADFNGYVRIGWVSEIVNWNPLMIEMVEDYVASSLMFSALFTYNEDWEGPVFDLATGYYQVVDPIDNSLTTYINITHNAYFRNFDNLDSTDDQLTAEDVEFTFNLIKSGTGYTYDWYFEEITVLGVANATGEGTFLDQIQLYTDYPKATLIDDITDVPILPKDEWEDDPSPFSGMPPQDLVGSGPFVFENYLKGGWYKFKTAPNYHGATDYPGERDVDFDGLLYTLYGGGDQLCVGLNEGIEDVVAVTGYMQAYRTILGKQANVNVIKAAVQEPGICDVAINAIPQSFIDHEGGSYGGGNPVLRDPYVRQAIMMTLNKSYIVDVLLHGLAARGSSVVQPGYWQAEVDELPFNPAAARQLLIDNNWSADADGDGYLEATEDAWAVREGHVEAGAELSGIRCQAPDTDKTYEYVALNWKGDAAKAGIEFNPAGAASEITMINDAWYKADYDIWVWHWGWGPEPIGGALSVWLTELIKEGGDNCQMPMGEWWYGWDNYTDAPAEWNLDGPYSSFDQNLSLAMETLDKAARKAILDPLQQVIYDSYCENPPFYDLGLYGYTDFRFEGWGDWKAHNGRNVASGLNWLWFDLEIVENRAPFYNTPPLDMYTAFMGIEKSFSVDVSDAEGDPITVDFSFGDGNSDSVTVDGDPDEVMTVTVSNTYDEVGDVTMYINMTDDWEGRSPDSREIIVEVQGEENESPLITNPTHDPNPPVYVGTPVTWTATGSDAESSTYGLKFTWDWNDGTYDVEEMGTPPDGEEVVSEQTHTWVSAGDYFVKINLYDYAGSEDNSFRNVTVEIEFEVVANMAPMEPEVGTIWGVPGVPVPCVATSGDADGDPLTFTWEWGDGDLSVEELVPSGPGERVVSEIEHTWETEGEYEVNVSVDDGYTDHNITVTVVASIASGNVPPCSFLYAIEPEPVYVGVLTTYNLSAYDANGDALTITVGFGDGSDPVVLTTEGGTTERQYNETVHAYDSVGTKTVDVEISDGTESMETFFSVSVVEPPSNLPPVLELQSAYTAFFGTPWTLTPVLLYDPTGDTITTWYDWGDDTPLTRGDPAKNNSATHTYMVRDEFTVTVYADDGNPGNNVSESAVVDILELNWRPSVELKITPTLAAGEDYEVGQELTFNVTVADFEGDALEVVIDFGDGSSETWTAEPEPKVSLSKLFTHSYDEMGEYEVNVTADDGMLHSNPELKYTSIEIEIADSGGGISTALLAGIAALVIILIVAALVMLMRRGKKKPDGLGEGGMEGSIPPGPPEDEMPPPQE